MPFPSDCSRPGLQVRVVIMLEFVISVQYLIKVQIISFYLLCEYSRVLGCEPNKKTFSDIIFSQVSFIDRTTNVLIVIMINRLLTMKNNTGIIIILITLIMIIGASTP